MSEVTRVDDEIWRMRQGIYFGDSFLEGGGDIPIWFVVEPDMAVADLGKGKVGCLPCGGWRSSLANDLRMENAAAHAINNARAHPGHALEESATINAIVIGIVRNWFFHENSFLFLFIRFVKGRTGK